MKSLGILIFSMSLLVSSLGFAEDGGPIGSVPAEGLVNGSTEQNNGTGTEVGNNLNLPGVGTLEEAIAKFNKKNATNSSEDARMNVSSEGYTDDAQKVKAATSMLVQEAQKMPVLGVMVNNPESLKSLDSAASWYSNGHGSCVKTQGAASYICSEKTSPKLHETLNQVNTYMNAFGAIAGVNDSCNAAGNAMATVKAGLTAYVTACSTARAACELSCSTVQSNLKRILEIVNAHESFSCSVNPKTPAIQMETALSACADFIALRDAKFEEIKAIANKDNDEKGTIDAERKSVALKNVACTYSYANMVASALTGIASMVDSMKQASRCDEASRGTASANKADICSDSTKAKSEECVCRNPQSPECLCFKNPRTPGCTNTLQKSAQNGESNSAKTGATDKNNLQGKIDGSGLRNPAEAGLNAGNPNGGGDGGGNLPTGGGAGLGSSSGGSDATPTSASSTKKPLDANILGGAGGGGGGSWNSSSISGSSSSKYRAYLPGGAKDPNKGMAGQEIWAREVTGAGGKSNWEKVKDRYRDNKNTLLNN
ncbi:hypothetical protein [Bdellovibrio bacteriovorus]|uniref:hypothetical protein n=1 Tax=Bdellovibrio TaxID=958 RepID=UPI0035A841A7